MDNQQAKLILGMYRPGGQDAQEPFFQEALAQAQRDPELEQWFAEERAWDTLISEKIKTSFVPADLKAGILAGQHASEQPRWRWKKPLVGWLSLAAAVVVGLLLVNPVSVKKAVAFEDYKERVLNFALTEDMTPKNMTTDVENMRQWLKARGGEEDFQPPLSVAQLNSIGCQIVDLNGQKASLICFWVDEAKREAVHLFVVDKSAIKNPPKEMRFYQKDKVIAAGWSDDRHTYILTGEGGEAYLKRFL